MSVIHFKFKNRQDYEKVAIDGLEVSGKELKEAIMKKKKIGHSNLEIRDAQTKKGEWQDVWVGRKGNSNYCPLSQPILPFSPSSIFSSLCCSLL